MAASGTGNLESVSDFLGLSIFDFSLALVDALDLFVDVDCALNCSPSQVQIRLLDSKNVLSTSSITVDVARFFFGQDDCI